MDPGLVVTFVGIIVAGLAVRMALAVQKLALGFDAANLLTLKAELPAARYPSDDRLRSFYEQLEKRLLGQPGIAGRSF